MARVRLPVELLPAREFSFLELVAHGLPREVERTLADGRVAVGVHGAEGVLNESPDELVASPLEAAPDEGQLVVLGAEVRMLCVDQNGKVGGERPLEVFDRLLLLFGCPLRADRLDRLRHLGSHGRIPQRPQLPQPRHAAVFFARNAPEQTAPLDDLLNGAIEGDRLPAVRASRPRALQDPDDAIRIVQSLDSGLPLRTERPFHVQRLPQWCPVPDRGHQGPRAVRVPFDLDGDTILDPNPDPATGVALKADRVKGALQTVSAQRTRIGRAAAVGGFRASPGEKGRAGRTTPGKCRCLEEVAAASARFVSRITLHHFEAPFSSCVPAPREAVQLPKEWQDVQSKAGRLETGCFVSGQSPT